MREFKIDENLTAVCESEKSRSGFRHIAVLLRDGNEIGRAKVCYQNRTWESFEFETVLYKLMEKSGIDSAVIKTFILNAQQKNISEVSQMFKSVAMIAEIGNILCDTTKEKADWKQRMLKAGLPDLQIPEDWDRLSDEEREVRLDKVIEFAKNVDVKREGD